MHCMLYTLLLRGEGGGVLNALYVAHFASLNTSRLLNARKKKICTSRTQQHQKQHTSKSVFAGLFCIAFQAKFFDDEKVFITGGVKLTTG